MASLTTSTFTLVINDVEPIPEQVPPIAIEEPVVQEKTLKEEAFKIATEHNISPKTFSNLIYYESRWNPDADNGYDRGIVQINRKSHPEVTDAQAFDPIWAMNWAADEIVAGKISQWTVCNCYSFMITQLGTLPRMANIVPNTTEPMVGSIAIFDYNGKKHVELVTSVTDDMVLNTQTAVILGANYEGCKIKERTINIDKELSLVGFYQPKAQ